MYTEENVAAAEELKLGQKCHILSVQHASYNL